MTAPALAHATASLHAPAFARGSVWLVGAGPGDPGLLTLHAAHALAEADVVLHDALVSPEIMTLAVTPYREAVGKRAHGARTRQIRINERLIALARQGLRVLRLKGGDPMIFGRGGEEALALAAAGVPFRIVPGVSAGIGATAAASIPLTHRGLARSVAFATGHDATGGLPDAVDLAALGRGAEVLVFYMGLRQAGLLAATLIGAGRSPSQSLAFIADATTPRQRVTMATLGTAASVAHAIDQAAPTLILVGPTLGLRDLLLPLQQTVPMTASPIALPERATA